MITLIEFKPRRGSPDRSSNVDMDFGLGATQVDWVEVESEKIQQR